MTISGMPLAGMGAQISPEISNNIIASGTSALPPPESQVPEMSPADSAISEIGTFLQTFDALAKSYPGVAESEAQNVRTSIQKYMERIVGSLSSSGGGESLIPTGY